jgi:glycosyltransferase involved in cell wall biosynthesis
MLRHYEQLEGGVKNYTRSLLPLLFKLGSQHQYTLIYQNPKLVGTYAEFPNVEELVSTIPGTVLWDQVAVPWMTRHKNLDIIFNPKFTIPFFHKAKKIWVFHGSEWFVIPEVFEWHDRIYTAAVVPLYCKMADGFISVAEVVKQDALKFVKCDASKIFTIHNGYDPKKFYLITDPQKLQSVKERYNLPDKYILWVGQIGTRKNITRLLQAFAQIAHEFPHDLVFAGEQRKAQNAKEAMSQLAEIKALGLEHRIRFLGWVEHTDLPAIYRLSDLFAFPSIYEGFGIPLIEAMACGCPILTATTCAPPEVVDGAGYLVDPMSVDAIASGMRTMLSDEALRQKLVARGLERAKDFSWEKCARQVLEVFEAVAPAARVS